MGGLVARVALLGSAQGWERFPPKLNVNNVVTLSSPHQGVAGSGPDDTQWNQMQPGSDFIKRLHAKGSGLDDAWADGTDWSLVGSHEDETVSHDSGIDKGNPADQKYGYPDDAGDSGEVTTARPHALRRERLQPAATGTPPAITRRTHTDNGWSPLKAAFQAATKVGDGLPK